jgi:hypothetical protein
MTAQLERLIQDSKQLDAYIKKLQKRGNNDRVNKLTMKRQFLNQTIAEFKEHVMQ